MLTLTLDTNCFFDYLERDSLYVQELFELAAKGNIELAATTRIVTDTLDAWKGTGTSPIWEKIRSLLPSIRVVGSAARLGSTRLGWGDFLISQSESDKLKKLHEIMPTAQIDDVDHLYGHITAGRDIFVTSDGHFLKQRKQLKEQFGVVIMNPNEAVQEIKKRLEESP